MPSLQQENAFVRKLLSLKFLISIANMNSGGYFRCEVC